ncbi:MAG TPA: hypothetical protein PLO65_09880, partial [Caulobacter sp.]|nr:hypothetical protein [Caulobacter sp.]
MTKTTHTLAVLAAGTFAVAGLGAPAPALAQYRTPPAQSLGDSCRDVQTLNSGYVTAVCRDTQGRYRWSSIYYPYCRSDLSNRNGVLACLGAEATVGGYVEQRDSSDSSPVGAILGAIAGALLGGGDQALYAPGARYPSWGEQGYGDPRYDPRFGEQGWGYGARGWVPINQRRAWLERRIARGQQQGSLTRAETTSLRRELTRLERLEMRYRGGGLSNSERADLDRRFDALAARIRAERRDEDAGWTGINQ